MSRTLNKAIQVYKNQGPMGVVRKSRSTLKYRTRSIRRSLSLRKLAFMQKNLREEFEFVSSKAFQINTKDIELSKEVCKEPAPIKIKTATWFVPYYDHFGFNGIQTIFRFMEKLSKEGVKNNIVIYDNPTVDTAKIRKDISRDFRALKNYQITVFSDDQIGDIGKLATSDIAFCTIWMSAYMLLRFNKTKRKYYFIQDYEPLFYVAGSMSALADRKSRFGFRGIVNTPGLLAAVNLGHGREGGRGRPAGNHAL